MATRLPKTVRRTGASLGSGPASALASRSVSCSVEGVWGGGQLVTGRWRAQRTTTYHSSVPDGGQRHREDEELDEEEEHAGEERQMHGASVVVGRDPVLGRRSGGGLRAAEMGLLSTEQKRGRDGDGVQYRRRSEREEEEGLISELQMDSTAATKTTKMSSLLKSAMEMPGGGEMEGRRQAGRLCALIYVAVGETVNARREAWLLLGGFGR